MKKCVLLIVCLAITFYLFGQVTITYTYDSAGNRTTRNVCETNVAFLLNNKSANSIYDIYSHKIEHGTIYNAFATNFFHETAALDKKTNDGHYKTHEWKNLAILVNDIWLDTRRKLNVRDRNNEKEPTL